MRKFNASNKKAFKALVNKNAFEGYISYDRAGTLYEVFKEFWGFPVNSLVVMPAVTKSLEELSGKVGDSVKMAALSESRWSFSRVIGVPHDSKERMTQEEWLEFALIEAEKASKAAKASKDGAGLPELWAELPDDMASLTQTMFIGMFKKEGVESYPNACWAPQPFMAVALMREVGPERYEELLVKLLDVARTKAMFYTGSDGEVHRGEVFRSMVRFMEDGVVADEDMDTFLRGAKFLLGRGLSTTCQMVDKIKGNGSITDITAIKTQEQFMQLCLEWGALEHHTAAAEWVMKAMSEGGEVSPDKEEKLEALLKVSQHLPLGDELVTDTWNALVWRDAGFERIPKNSILFRSLSQRADLLKALKPGWKYFQRLWLKLVDVIPESDREHKAQALAEVVVWFKDRAAAFIDKYGLDSLEMFNSLPYDETTRKWVVRETWKDVSNAKNIHKVASAAKKLAKNGMPVGVKGFSLGAALNLMSTWLYDDVEDQAFAMEASKWKMGQKSFTKWQKRWLKRYKHNAYETIPSVVAEVGDYRMSKLSKDDPRGPFLGEYTNCCQHPGSTGSSCAKHGMMKSDGGFYVVEKFGKIVAQSWTWRHKDIVCFDNIEALHDAGGAVLELYKEVSKTMIGQLGVKHVHVGSGYNDAEGLEDLPTADKNAKAPADCYTDADTQKVLA